jgi:hypothetical protein
MFLLLGTSRHYQPSEKTVIDQNNQNESPETSRKEIIEESRFL